MQPVTCVSGAQSGLQQAAADTHAGPRLTAGPTQPRAACRAQALESSAAKQPEAAAASGRALLNLRVRDAEGGLLGRTLLTLVSNKARNGPLAGPHAYQCCKMDVLILSDTLVPSEKTSERFRPARKQGGGSIAAPLPPHRLAPHDLVALRAARGGGGEPPLASGVVYRVREDALTVALEEAPEHDMDFPLRVDKLANEARHRQEGGCQFLGLTNLGL